MSGLSRRKGCGRSSTKKTRSSTLRRAEAHGSRKPLSDGTFNEASRGARTLEGRAAGPKGRWRSGIDRRASETWPSRGRPDHSRSRTCASLPPRRPDGLAQVRPALNAVFASRATWGAKCVFAPLARRRERLRDARDDGVIVRPERRGILDPQMRYRRPSHKAFMNCPDLRAR